VHRGRELRCHEGQHQEQAGNHQHGVIRHNG
jgi:hypothetical protein